MNGAEAAVAHQDMSMLQDVECGRKTEVLPAPCANWVYDTAFTPVNEMLYRMIRTIEQRIPDDSGRPWLTPPSQTRGSHARPAVIPGHHVSQIFSGPSGFSVGGGRIHFMANIL